MHSFDRTMLASLAFADPDKGDPRHDLACQYLAIPENQLTLGRRFSRERLYCHAEREEYLSHLEASTDPEHRPADWRAFRLGLTRDELLGGRPQLEYVINKGEGKYKTTVGFVDLRLRYAKKIERPFSLEEKEATFTFTDDQNFDKHVESARKLGMAYEDFIRESNEWLGLVRDAAPGKDALLGAWRHTAREALRERQAYRPVTRDYVYRDWSWSTLNVEVKANPVPIGNVIRQIKLYAEYVEGKWLLVTTYPLAASDVSALNSCAIGHVALGDRFTAWVAERRAKDEVEVATSTFAL